MIFAEMHGVLLLGMIAIGVVFAVDAYKDQRRRRTLWSRFRDSIR